MIKETQIIINQQKEFEILKVNRYEVQQNAVFLDYKMETLLQEIEKFAQTKFNVRFSMAKNLKTIQEIMIENYEKFGQLLQKLSKDHEDMQNQLLQYFKLKRPLSELPLHYKELVLSPLISLANGPFLQIKQQSCSLICELAHNFQQEQLNEILQFANTLIKSDNEQNKIVAIQLLAKLAHDLPSTKRQSIFQNEFLSIYSKSSVRVKKQIILELGKLAENLSKQFVDTKIVREFYTKQTKENAWGIRKSCVQVITQLLMAVKETKEELCNILLSFLKDGNKFVRVAAHKTVPQFIAKYGDRNVPKSIFDVYLTLIDLDINNQVSKPNEIVQKVAFYFPGVLKTVGSPKWQQLHTLFNRLLHNRSEDVKKPLADSLHEISKIIGPKHSKEYLFTSLDYILREQLDSIKLCAIRNLSKFVAQFENQTKQNLIDVFLVLQKDPKKWRVRFLISNQLQYLSEIYDAQTIFKYIFPISLKLCNDNVSEVRKAAAQQIIYVIKQLKSLENLYIMAIQSLLGFASSQKYLQRQTFCMMLESLYDKSQQFFKHFGPVMSNLANDEVSIVQISFAISIVNILKKHKNQYKNFKSYIEKLSENPEVKQYFQDIKQPQKEEVQNSS